MPEAKRATTTRKVGEGVSGLTAGGALATLLPEMYPEMSAQMVGLAATSAGVSLSWGLSVLRRVANAYDVTWLKILMGIG